MNHSSQDKHASHVVGVASCGTLLNSSYFDKPTKIICPKTNAFIDNPKRIQLNEKKNKLTTNDQNLYVRTCIFSNDSSHLAWNSGYSIVKLMKFRNAGQLKKSSMLMTESEKSNFVKDDIVEIDCGEVVKSMAFGSSNRKDTLRRIHFRPPKMTNNRFNIGDNNLILAVGLVSGKIKIYDIACLSLIMNLKDHKDVINDLKFTHDGSLQLMSASSDETIKLWNMYEDGNMYQTLKGHIGKVNMCDWSPSAKLVCSVGMNRQAYIWDTQTMKMRHTLRGHLHTVSACVFSPDGALVVTACYDTKICLWNPFSGELVRQFFHMLPPPRLIYAGGDNGAYIRDVSFSKEGNHLVSICDDKQIRVWSLSARSINPIASGEMSEIGVSCAYSSIYKTIVVGTKTGHLDVYRPHVGVAKLIDLCRKVVNRQIVQPVSELHLPKELKNFLSYDDIRDEPVKGKQAFMLPMSSLIGQGMALCN